MNPKFGRKDGPVMWKGVYEERPGTMVIFSNCRNIRIKDITLKDSPNWTLHFLNCIEVKVSGITINNDMNIPNSDGIDMYDSKYITISDCIINAGDDAIAVVSTDNLTVSNCVLHSRSSGIRIGYNVFNNYNSGNLLFNNIRIYDSNRGIGIFQRQEGDMKNMVFSNIIIDTRLHTGQWWGHGEPIHISALPGLGSKKVGKISNVRFSNIIATAETGMVFYGSKESVLEDIILDNVNISIKRGRLSDSYGGNIDLRPTNDISRGIFSHDIPAIYACYVKNFTLKDVQVNWGQKLPSYFTNAVECTQFKTVKINGLYERGVLDSPKITGPVVYLYNGQNADVKNITTEENKRTFLLQEKVINAKSQ
jgi:polygalacturonase